MLTTRAEILAHLTSLGIETETFDHPPVFTVEESQQHTAHLPGAHCKNLFLKDKKDRLWLVTCGDEQRVDLNRLAKALGAARFSFGRSELLREVLGVEPGSVTPLAIVNDSDGRVTHVLDARLAAQGSSTAIPCATTPRPPSGVRISCASSAPPGMSRSCSTWMHCRP